MYEDLETDNRQIASFKVTSYTPSGVASVVYNPEMDRGFRGTHKYFKGQRGKRTKKISDFPPPLNDVFIGQAQENSTTVELRTHPVHPKWGSRTWSGHFACDVTQRLGLLSQMPGNPEMDEALRDFALQKASSNVGAADFNSQLFLAEIAETISMLMNPLSGMQKVYKKFYRGRRRIRDLLKAQADATAGTYLQYMFGISPLIADVQDIYKMVQTKTISESQLYAKGSTRDIQKLDISGTDTSYTTFMQNLAWRFSGKTELKTTSKVYYNVTFENALWMLVQKWGFNPIMLPITLWETVPLSFVVDWFLGVKMWLNALRPKPGIHVLGNCTSERLIQRYTTSVIKGDLNILTSPRMTFGWIIDNNYNYNYDRLIRQVNLPIPVAPQWGSGIDSIGKAVSSVALSLQKLKMRY